MGDIPEFERAVGKVVSHVNFDKDIDVNLFEVTIRMVRTIPSRLCSQCSFLRLVVNSFLHIKLGGLLSAHILAEQHLTGANCTNLASSCSGYRYYKKPLLDLAVELGNRLLPAFDTPTGIPYSRVNLRYQCYNPFLVLRGRQPTILFKPHVGMVWVGGRPR